jgi:uncharacterized heparinase superfamily protein
MSALSRYASAIAHLGPRQTALNLLHRARQRTRSFAKYARPPRGLEWRGRARTPLLAHAGGARLDAGRLTAVGRTGVVGDPPAWEDEAPLLWLYNLHYFGWLAALPPAVQLRLTLDWIARYPPSGRRPGWWPYPLSLRLRHWACALFEGEPLAAERPRLLGSLEAQAECLADTLEYHLRGNHLLESGITLKLLAACVRGAAVARWERLANRVLEVELAEQFLLDGGHFERSPMYHSLLVHGLLDLMNVLPEEDEQRVRLAERMPSLLHFLEAMRHPDGEIALFNDAALGIAPEPGALLEYARRLQLELPRSAWCSFPETGYHVFRREGVALFVDAGPIGPDYLSTHAHGDLFSYELSLDGRRVVVDGGTSTYEAGAERDWIRSTRAHNTVEVADADQCEFFGAFRVGRRGRPRDVLARVSEDGLQLSGWHDGYSRLPGRPRHERELQWLPEGALFVWDRVTSRGASPAVSRVRFAPGAEIELTGEDAASIELEGTRLAFRAFGGVLALETDHYAPRFGERLDARVLALRKAASPDFGYALARQGLDAKIDAAGASVSGRRLLRRSTPLASTEAAR